MYDHLHLTTPFPRDLYYGLGDIEPLLVRRYTAEEVRQVILEHEHWGPWPA